MPARPTQQPRALAARRRGLQRGAVTTEYAVAFSVILLLVIGLLQFAAYYLASEVALNAAAEGARAARLRGGSATAGQAAAARYLAQTNQGAQLVNAQVTVTRTATQARARVTGNAQPLLPLPGLNLTVVEVAAGPVERFAEDSAP